MQRGYVTTSVGQLHYVQAGAGPDLVLIPHAGRSGRMYAALVAELAADFRVTVVDVPGTGRSAPLPEGATMAQIGGWYAEALAGLGLASVDLFGLHGGNKVGAAMAVRHPGLVRRFVYAGQSHSIIPDKATRDEIFRRTPSIQSVLGAVDPLAHWAGQFRENAAFWWDDALLASLADPAARRRVVDRVIDNLEAFQDRPTFYRAAFSYDMEADLRALAMPVLVLELTTPKEDREVGRQGAAVAALIPGARLEVLDSPDTYAVTLEDRAAEVAAILRGFFRG
ncbi:alpha/beta fold hydrolase [Ruixingdingia sedimenti]|uniref:Alpha/beta hydrolase n=1 Tax=Ruixingdingia sedimenti TaxID=3073604 RepID=A0ABU1F3N3_9RHOB|nr:alpha/beta hydrolase [Xinfangfangia sp. LG-4]MDR5651238.1 alpha/beta hydrolase [Xinfangfangia sp. LG-4]